MLICIVTYTLSCTSEPKGKINNSTNSNPTQKFEDFFEEFAKSPSFQIENIKFPLPVYHIDYMDEEGEKHLDHSIIKDEWEHESFQDRRTEVEGYRCVKEALNASEVLCIMRGIDNGLKIKYKFIHQNNNWMLVEIVDGST